LPLPPIKPQRQSTLAVPRHPDPPRPLVAVARRAWQSPARAALPGVRHAWHAAACRQDRIRLLLVRPEPTDHPARVCALRLRTESRPDGQGYPVAVATCGLEVWARAS